MKEKKKNTFECFAWENNNNNVTLQFKLASQTITKQYKAITKGVYFTFNTNPRKNNCYNFQLRIPSGAAPFSKFN